MVFFTLIRRILAFDLVQLESIFRATKKGNRNSVRNVKYRPPPRKPTIKFRSANKKVPDSWNRNEFGFRDTSIITMSKKFFEELRLTGGYLFPLSRFRESLKRKLPFASGKYYSSNKNPDKSKDLGGIVRQSGGRVGKLDAANEQGFFHKVNKSKTARLKDILPKEDPNDKKEK